jgi:hypothetical protein
MRQCRGSGSRRAASDEAGRDSDLKPAFASVPVASAKRRACREAAGSWHPPMHLEELAHRDYLCALEELHAKQIALIACQQKIGGAI